MTRLEALVLLLAEAADANLAENGQEVIDAIDTLAEMVAEVEGFKNPVDHALHVLHGEGCVPLVWGVAKDLLPDNDVPEAEDFTEEQLRDASEMMAKAWDKHAPEELHELVAETMHVIVSTQ